MAAQPIPAELRDLYALRALEASDRGFVVSTWVRSVAECGRAPWWSGTREAWLTAMRASVNATLDRARTVVLCSPATPSAIMGWACGEAGALHHAYVRPALLTTRIGRDWAERLVAAAKETA